MTVGETLTSPCGIVAIITKTKPLYVKAKIHGISFEARRHYADNGDQYCYFFGQSQGAPVWIKKGGNS
jgi:hypothetical protein